MLEKSQKYAIPVILVIVVAVLAAVAGQQTVDRWFGHVVDPMKTVLFWAPSYPSFHGLGADPSVSWAPIPVVGKMPLIVIVLFGGAIFFTLRLKFINIRGFKHAIQIIRGKYDNPDDPGEVTHFQALSSALSATVGLGNIAGVAIAVSLGGPGAVFWMMATALFGMTSKFTEVTLGQMYRQVDANGNVKGGPMVYLRDGLAELKPSLQPLGMALSVIFTVLCIGASLGGGNMFQANQSFQAITEIVPWLDGAATDGAVVLQADQPRSFDLPRSAVRFQVPAATAEGKGYEQTFVPTADIFEVDRDDWKPSGGQYRLSVQVIATHKDTRHNVLADTVTSMQTGVLEGRKLKTDSWTTPAAVTVTNPAPMTGGKNPRGLIYGLILAGLVGLVIIGGIKSIARVAEKIVPAMCVLYVAAALAVVFLNIDQVPTAVSTIFREAFSLKAGWGVLIGVFVQGVRRAAFSSEAGIGSAPIAHSAAKTNEPVREGLAGLLGPFIDTIVVCFMTGIVIVITGVYADQTTIGMEGISLTSRAFGSELAFFPIVLSAAVVLFAYSTMISWSYYGERCWTHLFGANQSMPYRILFLVFIVLGSVSSLGNVLDFSDLMLLSMAFPNILGAVMLSGKVAGKLDSYWSRYKADDFDTFD